MSFSLFLRLCAAICFYIFLSVNAYGLSISGINNASVEEFTEYTSPFPEALDASGNVVWSLYTEDLADYTLLRTLPVFSGMNDLQIILWLAFNYQKISNFTIDHSSGIVSLPPQVFSSSSSNNLFHAILIATDSSGAKAALHWTITITKNTSAGFTLHGIEDISILEKTPYRSATPYITGIALGNLSYSLSNDTSTLFYIDDSSTGIVSMAPTAYDAALDIGNNDTNAYPVTLIVNDEAGNESTISWTVTLEKLPAGHSFTLSGINNQQVSENSSYTSPRPSVSGKYNAPLIFSLSGADAHHFTVDNLGVVRLATPMDYENPLDEDENNIYEVTLVATDNGNETAELSWSVTITDLPVRLFTITGSNDSIQESNAYTSRPPAISGSYWPPLTFSIVNQEFCADDAHIHTDDACLFSIDTSSGVITMSAKVHAVPEDIDADNLYRIEIQATDREGTSQQASWSVRVTFTMIKDTDGDGVYDTYELAEGTDPYDASSYLYVYRADRPDALSTDADADGISNIDESSGLNPYGDNNNDGVPNYLDPYDRGDGRAALCTIKIINNYPDLDGNPSSKNICDTQFGLDPIYDRDQDGVPNFRDFDSDGDGIPDVIEGGMYHPSNTTGIPVDSDDDGIPDYLSLDSDGDGIPDNVENHYAGYSSNPEGIADTFHINTGSTPSSLFNGAFAAQGFNEKRLEEAILEGKHLADADRDGTPNYRSPDSDGDGIPDILEGTTAGADRYASTRTSLLDIDSNNNGIPDIFEAALTGGTDSNSNQIDDRYDASLTGGTASADYANVDEVYVEAARQAFFVNSMTPQQLLALAPNTSGRGTPDFLNLDSDGDCISDSIEAGLTGIMITDTATGTISLGIDSVFASCFDEVDVNGKPRLQFKDYSCLRDFDGDGIPDFRDLDSDNDGLMDVDEARTINVDIDRDGMCDNPTAAGALITDASLLLDTDGDGTPDYLDLMSDGTTLDITFVLPPLDPADYDTAGRIISTTDADTDGIDDLVDTDPANFGMLAIDCNDMANAAHPACLPPPVDCAADPHHPDCEPKPDFCADPINANLAECFEAPPQCQLYPELAECLPPPPTNCKVDSYPICLDPDYNPNPDCKVPFLFEHPYCLDPSLNPQNGKIKTNERGAAGMALLAMLFAVWFARRRVYA